YVQLHNRGIQAATNVQVKLLSADASAELPSLPSDFWTCFPDDAAVASSWTPIGAPRTIPELSTTEPVILEWDWSTPTAAANDSCLLVVSDCASDPIPVATKILDVGTLVPTEKR